MRITRSCDGTRLSDVDVPVKLDAKCKFDVRRRRSCLFLGQRLFMVRSFDTQFLLEKAGAAEVRK